MSQDAAVTVRVAENGRLSLPFKQRRELGLAKGGVVVIRVEQGELRLKPVQAVVDNIQAIAAEYLSGNDSVEQFIKDRRLEEERESERD